MTYSSSFIKSVAYHLGFEYTVFSVPMLGAYAATATATANTIPGTCSRFISVILSVLDSLFDMKSYTTIRHHQLNQTPASAFSSISPPPLPAHTCGQSRHLLYWFSKGYFQKIGCGRNVHRQHFCPQTLRAEFAHVLQVKTGL